MDVDAIGDELDEGALIEQGGEREPGCPMVEPRHRVEQVGRAGRAGGIARACLVERRAPSGRATTRTPCRGAS